jgi:hypothetical protein
MHCMIAWGSPNGPLQPSDHQAVEAVLQPYAFVRAFAGAGVLTITDNPQRLQVEAQLSALSKDQLQSRVQFLISPPMGASGFLYRGLLSQGLWEPINNKTKT